MTRRRQIGRGLATLGLATFFGMGAAHAGVPDGNPTVNVQINTTSNTVTQVTQVANDVILDSVWKIIATAYRENKQGKTPPPKFWEYELTVSDSDFATALAEVKSELYDLAVIPGRRSGYQVVQDEQTDQDLTQVTQSYEEVSTGSTTSTASTWSSDGQFGVDYIGDPADYSTWIAIGPNDVNVNVDQVTTTTEFIDAVTTTAYQSVAVWSVTGVQTVSPLVLDMDGDGAIQASGGQWLPHKELHKERMAFFDFHGDKFPVLMEWPGPQDGILCRPAADGKIDGTNLFGTSTGFANGYQALSVLDENGDGKISGKELATLSVWQDANSDARPQAGEVVPASQLHISEISLHQKNLASSFVKDGKTQRMYDWWPKTFELNRVRLMPKKA